MTPACTALRMAGLGAQWPGGVRQQFKAVSPLVEQILRAVKQGEGLQGPMSAEIWDDGDAVGEWSTRAGDGDGDRGAAGVPLSCTLLGLLLHALEPVHWDKVHLTPPSHHTCLTCPGVLCSVLEERQDGVRGVPHRLHAGQGGWGCSLAGWASLACRTGTARNPTTG